jgi:hypothetical protein
MCDLVIAPLALNSSNECMCVITTSIFLNIMLYKLYIYFMCLRWDSTSAVMNRQQTAQWRNQD